MKNIANKIILIILAISFVGCGDLYAAEQLLFRIKQELESCPRIHVYPQAKLMLIWAFNEEKHFWQLIACNFDGIKLWEKDHFYQLAGSLLRPV